MEEWFGLTPTGRQFREPAATLHEAEDAHGFLHTVVVFDAAYRGHPAISRDVELVSSFLQYPMVVGLVEMSGHDPVGARFAYPTGTFWTLKELMRICADRSVTIGLRAALELSLLVGQILIEAAENGASQGCFSHSGLTPWRIGIRPDGEVVVFGYGLPQVDVLCHHADPAFAISADSLRYAPPERLAGTAEDLAADTAALTTIAYELITGQPLYPGHDVDQIAKAVSMAEATTTLSKGGALPRPIAEMFGQSLVFDPDTRLTGANWLSEIAALHARHRGEGDSLATVATRLAGARTESPRRPAKLVSGATAMFTPEQLREASALRDEEDDAKGPTTRPTGTIPGSEVETRWKAPTRRRGEPSPDLQASDDGAPAASEEPVRPRRRMRTETGELPLPPDPATDEEEVGSDTEARPRRRSEVAAEPPPGRRRRRLPEES